MNSAEGRYRWEAAGQKSFRPVLPMDTDPSDENRPLSNEERDKAVTMYEKYINDRLKVDMHTILTSRDKVYEELSA